MGKRGIQFNRATCLGELDPRGATLRVEPFQQNGGIGNVEENGIGTGDSVPRKSEGTTEDVGQITANRINSELARKRTWRIDKGLMIGERRRVDDTRQIAVSKMSLRRGNQKDQVESKMESKTQLCTSGQ